MLETPVRDKDPVKVRAGTLGAERRWSNPANRRIVHLDALGIRERAIVLALIAAAKGAKADDG